MPLFSYICSLFRTVPYCRWLLNSCRLLWLREDDAWSSFFFFDFSRSSFVYQLTRYYRTKATKNGGQDCLVHVPIVTSM
ncbi:hypothetical protein RvY_05622 [Ramazzottius varieornatus]|uniref:Uncharacterized protein n=1 Tax=Ramazzottius varieornatus TaxID=947166 RepID=A0A1D1UVP4_RAMVA|nr:hypothetical protein RvY_05622 [Ramazzottius varieornatus]